MAVRRNKAVVGANAFAHESGIHQDGILKRRSTYEIMRPEDIGMEGGLELVLGKHSGRHAFRNRLAAMGFKLNAEELERAYARFIELADKKKAMADDDLLAIARDEMEDVARHLRPGIHPGINRIEHRAYRDGPLDKGIG